MSTDEFFTWTGDHNMDVWAADVYGTEERKPESLPAVLADKAAVEAPKAVLFGNEARGLNRHPHALRPHRLHPALWQGRIAEPRHLGRGDADVAVYVGSC